MFCIEVDVECSVFWIAKAIDEAVILTLETTIRSLLAYSQRAMSCNLPDSALVDFVCWGWEKDEAIACFGIYTHGAFLFVEE